MCDTSHACARSCVTQISANVGIMASESPKTQVVLFRRRPEPMLEPDCMEIVDADAPNPASVGDGNLIIRPTYFSVDPYMRGRMNAAKSYAAGFELGKPMNGGSVGVVEAVGSAVEGFAAGDVVTGYWSWARLVEVPAGGGIRKIPEALLASGAPPSLAIGACGMPGLSALLPLKFIADPQAGETVWVTGAAGAVGMTVGQLCKIKGCRVIGSAGSDEKVAKLREVGFDEAFNYKTTSMRDAIKAFAPEGINVFWDNVGGEATEIALECAATDARFVMCGAISQYNLSAEDRHPIRNLPVVIAKHIRMQGFIVTQYMQHFAEGAKELAGYVLSGQLKFEETVHEGFEALPSSLCALFSGKNTGKLVVKV